MEQPKGERCPNVELQQWAFLQTLPDSVATDKAEKKQQLLEYIEKNGTYIVGCVWRCIQLKLG
jgi:hypothetical protein